MNQIHRELAWLGTAAAEVAPVNPLAIAIAALLQFELGCEHGPATNFTVVVQGRTSAEWAHAGVVVPVIAACDIGSPDLIVVNRPVLVWHADPGEVKRAMLTGRTNVRVVAESKLRAADAVWHALEDTGFAVVGADVSAFVRYAVLAIEAEVLVDAAELARNAGTGTCLARTGRIADLRFGVPAGGGVAIIEVFADTGDADGGELGADAALAGSDGAGVSGAARISRERARFALSIRMVADRLLTDRCRPAVAICAA
jgi:hypothetical protein